MQIVPIRDLRDTNAIRERCLSSNEPVFVTRNGYGELVIMSMETYEQRLAMADLYAKLAVAEKEREEGRMLDGPGTMAELTEG